MTNPITATVAIYISFLASTLYAQTPQTSPDSITQLITADVVGVAKIDLEQIDFEPALKLAESLFPATPKEIAQTRSQVASVKEEIDALTTILGVKRFYVIVRTSDVPARSPCFAIRSTGNRQQQPFIDSIKDLLRKYTGVQFQHRANGEFLIFGPSKEHLDSLLAGKPHSQTDIINKSVLALGDHGLTLTLFGNSETRRVMRELMPAFDRPFKQLTGPLIADHVRNATLHIQFKPKPNVLVTVDADSPENAAIASKLMGKGINRILKSLTEAQEMPGVVSTTVAQCLKPTVTGNRATVSAEKLIADSEMLAKTLAPTLLAVKRQAQAKQVSENLRVIGIAALNYESAHGHFPDNICDENGKPLLSWRVAILPYMQQNELYQLFKLDEPWDSEHNLKAAQNLPAPFVSPNDGSDNNEQFKTTLLRPAGENTLLDGKEMKFSKITDGASNTIFALSVASEHAVVWTRPTDWNYAPANPKRGLAIGKVGGETPMVRCDTSTEILKDDSNDQGLRNVFTINDRRTEQP